MASKFFYDGEYEKMKKLLGEQLSLKSLYPKRDVFNLSEVLNYLKISVLYYGGVENIEKAEFCYETMQEIENKFDIDTEESSQISSVIATIRMRNFQKKIEEEEKTKITVTVNPAPVKQQSKSPVFNHDEINMLYNNGFEIHQKSIEQILSLPRESLIEDLLKVLFDSIDRYEHFQIDIDENGFSEENHSFAIHAFFLLGNLEAIEVLPNILNYLKRDYNFYDFWYSDIFTEYLWEPLYKIGNNKLDELKQFMLEPGISTHAKSLVYEIAEQVAIREQERRTEVIQWYKEIFTHFLNSTIEDNVIDSDLVGLMTWSAIDLKATELLPEIKELYERNYPTLSICGNFDDVKASIEKGNTEKVKEILPMAERYTAMLSDWDNPTEFPEIEDDNESVNSFSGNMPQKEIDVHQKVGRNEPCPCGSGKKYKKCCLNKS